MGILHRFWDAKLMFRAAFNSQEENSFIISCPGRPENGPHFDYNLSLLHRYRRCQISRITIDGEGIVGGGGMEPLVIFNLFLSYRWLFRGHSTMSLSGYLSRRPGPSGRFGQPPLPWPAYVRPSHDTSRAPRDAAPSRGCGAPRFRGPRRCRFLRSPSK